MKPNSSTGADAERSDAKAWESGQGIVRDQRGQDQPKDRERAQRQPARVAQEDEARQQQEFPGQPAGGE